MAPNNLKDAPQWAVEFMKNVPTTWDEVKFIDGYPGKYVVLARRTGDKWYIAGINAEKAPLKLKLSLPMFEAGKTVDFYNDDAKLNGGVKQIKISKKKEVNVVIPCNGGFVIK